MPTELLYLRDAELRAFDATVLDAGEEGVVLDQTAFYVTGGNMEPLSARMDFEFDPLPEGFGETMERKVNEELAAGRPIKVQFLPRETAVEDEDLIRTKVRVS